MLPGTKTGASGSCLRPIDFFSLSRIFKATKEEESLEEAKNVVTDFRHKIFDDAFVLGGVICPGNSLGTCRFFTSAKVPLTLFGTRVQRSAPLSCD